MSPPKAAPPGQASPAPAPGRGVYCNRTLNLRGIKAVGYDMDYTLVHYHVEAWERLAYEHLRARFSAAGWPVDDLEFDPAMVIRGLVIDLERGNILKANRFGFVKRAAHGTRLVDYEVQRRDYARTIIDLGEPRWTFLNTLFSLSEGCMYAQLVDRFDADGLPGVLGYADLYRKVRSAMDALHMEGRLKAEIMASKERFVARDPELPLALLDQKHAGKKLLLITNSEWSYTVSMMEYALGGLLPRGQTWRDLFDVVIVGARKPDFFTKRSPFFEVATPEGLLRPDVTALVPGGAYLGGSAVELERHLGISGDEILYVGDHMFGDINASKSVLRWRTALVLRELESEVVALAEFAPVELELAARMERKEAIEEDVCQLRVAIQRVRAGYGPPPAGGRSEHDLHARIAAHRVELDALDAEIAPLARRAAELANPRWGLLMRAGNDKSHLARQVERYADVYTSRVANLLYATPFVYLRSPRGSLPHDPLLPGGRAIV